MLLRYVPLRHAFVRTAELQLKNMQATVQTLNQAIANADAMAEAHTSRLKNLDALYKKEFALRKKFYNELQDAKGESPYIGSILGSGCAVFGHTTYECMMIEVLLLSYLCPVVPLSVS